jgi:hypothetical protein
MADEFWQAMRRTPWLKLSLALNVFLLAVVLCAAQYRSARSLGSGISTQMTNRQMRFARQSSNNTSGSNEPASVLINLPFNWSQLESEDYRAYVANLRAIGCPAATVRDVIVADVQDLFSRRVTEMVSGVQNRFWDLMTRPKELEQIVNTKGEELKALENERDSMLDELLGPASKRRTPAQEEAELEQSEMRKQFFDFLPAEKVEQCLAVDEKINRLREELSTSQPPLSPSEQAARLKGLQEQQEAAFGQLLAPDELAEYRLRSSRFADLRFHLAGTDATEEELRELVRIREKFSPVAESKEPNVDLRATLRAEAQKQQQEELKNILGPERFAQLQRAQDGQFQEIYRLTSRFELPAQIAADAYEMRKEAEAAARRLRADQTMSEAQRNDSLKAIREETERSMAGAFGSAAYAIYRQRWGQWLGQLEGAQP